MNHSSPETAFPLIFLQPVANGRHAWVALGLDASPPLTGDGLGRLFGEFGLYEALDNLACIVPVSAPENFEELGRLLPAEQIVLRLPTPHCLHPDGCGQTQGLANLGFRLLADGLPPAGRELCPEVAAVAVDCHGEPPAVAQLSKRLGHHLALGVAAPHDFKCCQQAGFDWFAGNYPLHPDGERLPDGTIRHALLLELLTLIARDADSHQIETLIKQDAHLSYQLLKLVNSVAFSLSNKITSFGQAITLLGRRQLQRWLQLLLYARPEGNARSPLMPRAALRAGLMEALCVGRPREIHDRAFMAGVFSLLDLLLAMPMAEILAPLNLAEDVAAALLEHSGPLGGLLRIVEAAEEGDADALSAGLTAAGIDSVGWAIALVKAYHWAIRVSLEA